MGLMVDDLNRAVDQLMARRVYVIAGYSAFALSHYFGLVLSRFRPTFTLSRPMRVFPRCGLLNSRRRTASWRSRFHAMRCTPSGPRSGRGSGKATIVVVTDTPISAGARSPTRFWWRRHRNRHCKFPWRPPWAPPWNFAAGSGRRRHQDRVGDLADRRDRRIGDHDDRRLPLPRPLRHPLGVHRIAWKRERQEAVRRREFGKPHLGNALVGRDGVNVGTKAAEHQPEIMRKRKRRIAGDHVDPPRRDKLIDRAVEVVHHEAHDGALQIAQIMGERMPQSWCPAGARRWRPPRPARRRATAGRERSGACAPANREIR